ncbi:hypothetical protein [Sphingomonas sp. RS2018]
MTERHFGNFAVIDWSGEAVARPKGLAVALASTGTTAPELMQAEGGLSRQRLLDWLLKLADAGSDILIGLDLSPALPFADRGGYFPGWDEDVADARALWALVDRLSADDQHLSANGFLAHVEATRHFRHQTGTGDLFGTGRGRLRVCEAGQQAMGLSPSSCFNLIGAAQVGKSSLTGMRVLHRLAGRVPVWPFDPIPKTGPAIVEIYTTIAARAAGLRKGLSKIRCWEDLDIALAALGSAPTGRSGAIDDHASDAILTAAWLRANAARPELWQPAEMTDTIARTEGWTFGVA